MTAHGPLGWDYPPGVTGDEDQIMGGPDPADQLALCQTALNHLRQLRAIMAGPLDELLPNRPWEWTFTSTEEALKDVKILLEANMKEEDDAQPT